MGLPLDQCRGNAAGGGGGVVVSEEEASAGCRTPSGVAQGRAAGETGEAGGVGRDCPAAPRKRRAAPVVAPVSQQQRRRDFYTGADVDAFFAAHNL
ncbi:hypothetical protein GUJ93_ZPchr0003g18397 [Zizania palustris]|uniref:Uncharacterized protein n=1 Tax=Zizania palustris TaxID=103762 RepID=A0A8J5SEC9_ZIZPA|nr:hypothetical protein GUJ93_ZPchr0003g18397 [Zizania palustris]